MKLSFPVGTFNAHAYLFTLSEKLLPENMQKTLGPHNVWGKIKATRSENHSLFYCMLWYPKFGVTFGQRSHAKIDIMWFAA